MAVVEGGTGIPEVDSNLSFGLTNVAGTVFYLPRYVALDLSGATPKDVGMAVALAVPGATGRVVAGKVSGQGLTTSDAGMPLMGKTAGNTALHAAVGANGELATYNPYGTGTVTSVTVDTTVDTLAAANTARRSLLIYNAGAVVLYVKFGATATTSDYSFQLAAGAFYESPATVYTGIVTGITASSSVSALVTEGT